MSLVCRRHHPTILDTTSSHQRMATKWLYSKCRERVTFISSRLGGAIFASSTLTSPGGILFKHWCMIFRLCLISSIRIKYLRGTWCRSPLSNPCNTELHIKSLITCYFKVFFTFSINNSLTFRMHLCQMSVFSFHLLMLMICLWFQWLSKHFWKFASYTYKPTAQLFIHCVNATTSHFWPASDALCYTTHTHTPRPYFTYML